MMLRLSPNEIKKIEYKEKMILENPEKMSKLGWKKDHLLFGGSIK